MAPIISKKCKYDVGDLVAMKIANEKPRYTSGIVVRCDKDYVYVKMNYRSIERKFHHRDLYFFLNKMNKTNPPVV